MTNITLSNGTVISLLERDGVMQGLGTVAVQGTVLRSGDRPAFVQIRTPDGFEFSDWRIKNRDIFDDAVTLELTPSVRGSGLMEWMLHEVRPRINTSDWSKPPQLDADTSLRLKISSVNGQFGIERSTGFSYQYHYYSGRFPIYKILDRSTWEIGERACGNSFWLRNNFAPCIKTFTNCADSYSTEWYQPNASNSSIFQFVPWQTALEGFSLTFSSAGALVTWTPKVSHIRSLFEKPAGSDAIFHWHEHCGDLSNAFSSAPIEVVWIPGALDEIGRWNLYEKVREYVSTALHADACIRKERITTYGVMEEWQVPDLARYRTNGLPKLLELGVKTIFLPNEFQNNMNTFGVSNMCCTFDYKVAETVGEDKLKDLCTAAADRGATVEMWGNTALSTLVPIFAKRDGGSQRVDFPPTADSIFEVLEQASDPYVRNSAGAIEADHYSPVFAQLNLRDQDIYSYWIKRWKYAFEQIGIGGIFLDSSCNMTSDKFHWVENTAAESGAGGTVDQSHLLGKARSSFKNTSRILSQYQAHIDLIVDMQSIGYRYCGEDIGVFGTHRSGPGIAHRLDNLPMWSDCLANFCVDSIAKSGEDPDTVFFKGLAYRMMWQLYWIPQLDIVSFTLDGKPGDRNTPNEWHRSLLRAYCELEKDMCNRTILADGSSVLYSRPGSGNDIIWCFNEISIRLPEHSVIYDVLDGTELRADALIGRPNRVYRIATPNKSEWLWL